MVRLTLVGAVMAALLAGLASAAWGAAWGVPGAQRQAELIHRLKHDCGSCHGLTMKGGLGPPLLPRRLAERPEDDLVAIILNGVAGTPMAPWKFELSEEEARWIVHLLNEGVPQ